MSYTLIKGHFYVLGHSPDGDSIKFKANNAKNWDKIITDNRDIFEKKLADIDEKTGVSGVVTLRLQGIDALETHFAPPTPSKPDDIKKIPADMERPKAGNHDQPHDLGLQATDYLLGLFGIKETKWHRFGYLEQIRMRQGRKDVWLKGKFTEKIPGFIITRDVERKGRPISWVFTGTTRTRDGSTISKKQLRTRITRSANYKLLKEGLVYPYFYMTLPAIIRTELIEAVEEAQKAAAPLARSKRRTAAALKEARAAAAKAGLREPEKVANLWVYDRTMKGVRITRVDQITDTYEMWPYLFRKILKHWHKGNIDRFYDAVRDKKAYDESIVEKLSLKEFFDSGNPYMFIVSQKDFVRLDEIVELKGGTLKLNTPPQDLVFLG